MDPTCRIRPMAPADRLAVAELIHHSTNAWYTAAGRAPIFRGDPHDAALFFDVYHALPGSGGLVVEDDRTGRPVGSCFYHDRPTHVSLGIMNVHAEHFGQGLAAAMLDRIIEMADRQRKPLRLVSSAMNLDSFSLYTRKGFVPRGAYQDMFLPVPPAGWPTRPPQIERVRPASPGDVDRIAELELAINHIRRDGDYRHFIANPEGIWHASVLEGADGALDGFLASCAHPACRMLGPGFARTPEQTAALIAAELNAHAGHSPVFLVPVQCADLVRRMYDWGARNCELHFSQVRGHWPGLDGVNLPTFMPETA